MSENQTKSKAKLFAWIYYPVIIVLSIVIFALSLADVQTGFGNKIYTATKDYDYYANVNSHISQIASESHNSLSAAQITAVRGYLTSKLTGFGFKQADETKNSDSTVLDDDTPEVTTTDWYKNVSGVPQLTVTTQTAIVTQAVQNAIEGFDDQNNYVVGREISNVIAAIPGTDTIAGTPGKAVVITVRYDTRDDTDGATENTAFVATALEQLYRLKSVSNKNDIIVVFTEDDDYAYGTYCFNELFTGLNNAPSRAVVGLSLEAYGTGGTLSLTAANKGDYQSISNITSVTGSALNNSVLSAVSNFTNTAAVYAFDAPAFQVAVYGNQSNSQSQNDNIENLSQSMLYSQTQFFDSFVAKYGSASEVTFSNTSGAAYASYFDFGTIVYSNIASYVLAALILLFVVAAFIVNTFKKSFSAMKVVKSAACALSAIIISTIILYGAFYLVLLLCSGLGFFTVNALGSLVLYNPGMFIALILLSIAILCGVTPHVKKLYYLSKKATPSAIEDSYEKRLAELNSVKRDRIVEGDSLVRGVALLISVIGAVVGFAAPAAGAFLVLPALLVSVVFLCDALLSGMLANKGKSFGTLFIYSLALVIAMPIFVPALVIIMKQLAVYFIPLVLALFMLFLMTATPYSEALYAPLQVLAGKSPARTVTVESVVTEKVEDQVKKGKFTEVTRKKRTVEKYRWNYKNYFGVTTMVVIAVAFILGFGSLNTSFSSSAANKFAYNDAMFNDAIIYTWDNSSGSETRRLEVYDHNAYNYIGRVLSGFTYDSANGCYYKSVSSSTIVTSSNQPTVTKSNGVYEVKPYDGARSYVELHIEDANSITSITITGESEDDTYSLEFLNRDEITLTMPYGFGTFTMTIEGAETSTINYTEKRPAESGSNNPLDGLSEWAEVLSAYNGTEVADFLRAGVLLKTSVTL